MKKLEAGLSIITITSIHLLLSVDVRAQEKPSPPPPEAVHPIRPSLAAIIAMLSALFSLLFLMLAYAKFCHRPAANHHHTDQNRIDSWSNSRFSGIDRKVIESLPYFRYSSLKGSKEGLECAVCLSKFDDSEILRLLPDCNHAFHMNCIDRWLERHSSCPLCRHKLNPRELSSFSYSMSFRFSRNPSNLSAVNIDSNLELYIQRHQEDRNGSSKEEEVLVGDSIGSCSGGDAGIISLHKFKHRIFVSDVVIKNRWSDVNSSDLMFLSSEMLGELSSKRISESRSKALFINNGSTNLTADEQISETDKVNTSRSVPSSSSYECSSGFRGDRPRIMDSAGKRSMSEITNLSRFAFSLNTRGKESPCNNRQEERVRRVWVSIARRTVRWLAGRETSSDDLEQHKFCRLNV